MANGGYKFKSWEPTMAFRTCITCITLVATALCGIAFDAYGQSKEPANGPELVEKLDNELGVVAALNREGKIYLASIDRGVDVEKAVGRLVEIPTIQVISIMAERLDGATLRKLAKLPNLVLLQIRNCGIEDKDMAGIEGLTKLRELQLTGNPITDKALVHLKPLKELELLYLSRTKVTGAGFEHLQGLPKLRNLYLSMTPITDDSMKALGKIQSLRVLDMHGTSISSEGVMHLTGLYQLFKLVVGTHVPDTFVKEQALAQAEAESKGLLSKDHPQLKLIDRESP